MRKAADILPRAVERPEILRAARASRALAHWPEVVGEFLAQRSRPDRYDRGTVFVAVTGSAWAQELRMRRDEILDRLREGSGEPSLFLNIRFGVRALPEQKDPEPPDALYKIPPEDLTIREIANRRLAAWKREPETPANDAGGTVY